MAFEDIKRNMMEPVFPEDRPNVSYEEQRQVKEMSKEQILSMPVDQLVDMEIIDMVVGRKRVSEDWRKPRRLEWDLAWSNYNQIYDRTNKQKWQSTIFIPMIQKHTEVILSNMHGALLGPEIPFEWQDRGRPDLQESIGKHNKIIAQDFEMCKFKAHATDFLRTLILCGTGIAKTDYVRETEEVMVKERRRPSIMDSILSRIGGNQAELERFVPKVETVKDYARLRNVDLYDVYPEPYTQDIGKDHWIIQKGKITNKELIDGSMDQDEYYRLDNITPSLFMSNGRSDITNDPEKQTRRMAFLDYDIQSHHLEPDMEHELLEYYGPIPQWFLNSEVRNDPKKKYDTVPGWIWVVDGQYVVRKRISPWRGGEPPYSKGNYIRIPNQFYGLGVGQILRGLQIETNELRNLNVDNINITMNKILAVLKDKVPPGEWGRLVSEPGALWVFQNINKVQDAFAQIDFPDQGRDIWLAQDQIRNEAHEASGAVKATIGTGGAEDEAGGGTFRGQMMNKQIATERFMLYSRVLNITGFGDIMNKFYQRIYQFKSYKEIDELLGKKQSQGFELIPPETLEKVAKLIPLGVISMENVGLKLANMREFAKIWGNEPFFKKLEMARQMAVEMKIPDPDSVLFSDEEMQQFIDFKKQMISEQVGGVQTPPIPQGGNGSNPISGPINEAQPATLPEGPGVRPVDMAGIGLS